MTMQNPTASSTPLCLTRLIGPINEKSVVDVIKDIDQANSNDAKKSVIFTIASSGGLLYYAQALYDSIKASKKPVTIVASGVCMSAALMILQAGHKRISRPDTFFMVHQASYWLEQHMYIDEMNVINDQWNRSANLFVKHTLERSILSREEFDKIAKPRKYFDSEEAKKWGFIDEISDKWIESY